MARAEWCLIDRQMPCDQVDKVEGSEGDYCGSGTRPRETERHRHKRVGANSKARGVGAGVVAVVATGICVMGIGVFWMCCAVLCCVLRAWIGNIEWQREREEV